MDVVTDRLGSVRANGQGEYFAYFPFGNERTTPEVDGRDKFGTYFRDTVGQDYADQRYYGATAGRFWSVDPGGIKKANAGDPMSWNRYIYVQGDPINSTDRDGLFMCARCVNDDGGGDSGYNPPTWADGPTSPPLSDSDQPSRGSSSSNPCSFGNLSPAQQALLANVNWGSESAAAQQMFATVTADAATLGLNLVADGFTVSSIQVVGQGGQSETELNLSGGSVADLVSQMGNNFTSQAQDPLVGAPHSGYTGNYRQNTLTWSMQINTNIVAGTVQIDIDPYNPSGGLAGLLGHGLLQVLPNHITGADTNYVKAANALQNRGVNVGSPCTGGN